MFILALSNKLNLPANPRVIDRRFQIAKSAQNGVVRQSLTPLKGCCQTKPNTSQSATIA